MRMYGWETVINEGAAKIIVPNPELFKRPDGVYEPAWAPVFYNPRAKFNRDVAMAFTASYFRREYFFIEPLAGCGVRSIRYALETQGYGIANDIDPIAYYYIIRNIELNNLKNKLIAFNYEANSLLNTIRSEGLVVDYIDIDPYGTPIPFIDSASHAISRGGVISVTATDTGPLNCSHPNVCRRRYGAVCYRTDFSKEMGLRILVGSIVRRAASHDIALEPLLAYYHDYYYRAYFKAYKSAKRADELLKNIGYIIYNPDTLERRYIRAHDEEPVKNELLIGPLWIGPLANEDVLNNMMKFLNIKIKEYGYYREVLEFIKFISNEYKISMPYYRYDKLFGRLKRSTPPINEFIELIKSHGYNAHRTHFDPKGVRTDMPFNELIELIKSNY